MCVLFFVFFYTTLGFLCVLFCGSWPFFTVFTGKPMKKRILSLWDTHASTLSMALTVHTHAHALRRHRAELVDVRVRLVALFFALTVPLGGVLDALVFEVPHAAFLIGLRVLASGVFVALVWAPPLSLTHPLRCALFRLAVLMAVPPFFYMLTLWGIDPSTLTPLQHTVMTLYTYLPTVVLGGMALFPLTVVEVAALALPVTAVAVWGVALSDPPLSLAAHGAGLWFMVLMGGTALFSCVSQVVYMRTLVMQSQTDPLTGALTRRSGEEALALALRMAHLTDKPLTVLFVDLDHFKAVNDQYGHEAGDTVLKGAAQGIMGVLRRSDTLVRWGGEEFVVILPTLSREDFAGFYERFCSHLGRRPDGTPVTASVGAVEALSEACVEWKAAVKKADERMYRAKTQGRNNAVTGDR
jgi:diguanylate cyclase (GGDEF)-like protein